MAAPVRIEARAWSDIRFRTLARLLGMSDPDLALIKVARLWSWETEHYHPDRPTYVLDRDTIESVLGPDGPEALVRAQLAEATMDGWRMKGTEGQIEWCYGLTEKRQRAGRARADNASRDERGRLTARKSGDVDNSSPPLAGCAGPAPVQHPPAQSSAPSPSPSPSHSQEEEIARTASAPIAKPKAKRVVNPAHHPTRQYFETRYRERYTSEHTWTVSYAKQLSTLLSVHGEAEVRARIDRLFSVGLEWPRGPYTFRELHQFFDKLVADKRDKPRVLRVVSVDDEPDLTLHNELFAQKP